MAKENDEVAKEKPTDKSEEKPRRKRGKAPELENINVEITIGPINYSALHDNLVEMAEMNRLAKENQETGNRD